MDKTANPFDDKFSKVNEENLLTKIWTNPTETFSFILKNCPEKNVSVLLVLGGIVRAIDRASVKDLGDQMPTFGVLTLAILFGGALGWVTYYIYAWGMSVTGKWIDGKADPSKFRTIIAWALVPSICSLILLVPQVIIFGDDLFKSNPMDNSMFNNISWIVFGVIELTLGLWTLVILVKGVSLIQGFKIGKSILNIIFPGLVIAVPIILLAVLVDLLN